MYGKKDDRDPREKDITTICPKCGCECFYRFGDDKLKCASCYDEKGKRRDVLLSSKRKKRSEIPEKRK